MDTPTVTSAHAPRPDTFAASHRPLLATLGLLLLAAFMATNGWAKVSGEATLALAGLRVPGRLVLALGVVELAGALALLVPPLRFVAAVGLTVLLTGAVAAHLVTGDLLAMARPFLAGLVAVTVAFVHVPVTQVGDASRSPRPRPTSSGRRHRSYCGARQPRIPEARSRCLVRTKATAQPTISNPAMKPFS